MVTSEKFTTGSRRRFVSTIQLRLFALTSWISRHREVLAYLALLTVALGMRLWGLQDRAIHHDESLHAMWSWYLSTGGGFRHDPLMHGPFLFHGNALIYSIFGDSDFTARLLPALFGTALVALPYFFRGFLGRPGALVVAIMLAFSPSLLYFSRFIRNDIYMAVWTFALVILVWQYIYSPRRRYLFGVVALLAFALTTKETAFITVGILGIFLFGCSLRDLLLWVRGRLRLSQFSPSSVLLLTLFTLTLPQWAALISLGQGPMGIILANPDYLQGPVGIPLGTGLYVAGAVVFGLILISVFMGTLWNARLWPMMAILFYGIWLFFFTTFFTNLAGGATGVWQGLGYWLAQQDVQRGSQPWYYYFVIGGVYEFLPLLFAILGAIYYLVKGGLFDKFLVYWALLTFLAYSVAGERMPWLLVNVTLPLIVLSGKFLGHLIRVVRWENILRHGGLVLMGLVLLGLVLLPLIALRVIRDVAFHTDAAFWLFLLIAVLIVSFGVYVGRTLGRSQSLAIVGLGVSLLLVGLSLQVGLRAVYQSNDAPVEMFVYAQATSDVVDIVKMVDVLAEESGKGKDLHVVVDDQTWPLIWYLRDYHRVEYACFFHESRCKDLDSYPDADIILLKMRSIQRNSDSLVGYTRIQEYKHMSWFPQPYKGLTLDGSMNALISRKGWRGILDYFLFRELGSSQYIPDSVAYIKE
jgi:uncharacterized protein (TIGR03663 family)